MKSQQWEPSSEEFVRLLTNTSVRIYEPVRNYLRRDIFIGGAGGHCPPPLNFDNPKRSRIWEAYVVVRLAAT